LGKRRKEETCHETNQIPAASPVCTVRGFAGGVRGRGETAAAPENQDTVYATQADLMTQEPMKSFREEGASVVGSATVGEYTFSVLYCNEGLWAGTHAYLCYSAQACEGGFRLEKATEKTALRAEESSVTVSFGGGANEAMLTASKPAPSTDGKPQNVVPLSSGAYLTINP